ncbi:MAG TPA: hypothetical protein ENJ37_03855 [Deltaproteobacteria bacterium]|nr:hypothetical protein [Deltaproteobacteria bacterium]
MKNPTVEDRARAAADELVRLHAIDRTTALHMTTTLWNEVRRRIVAVADGTDWRRLSFEDKAMVCTAVVRALLDGKRLGAFLAGERKTLV